MCETLQLNWKLPNPLKPLTNSSMNNNNNNNKRKSDLAPKVKTATTSSTTATTTGSGRQKKANAKYGLRAVSIQKRAEVEGRKGQPRKRGPKPRPKPQPMSKYRRRTANLRERMRMGEINTAFENLREKIPTPLAANKGRCEKLTKINILHVAINYIRALESILDTGDAGVQIYGTSVVRSPFDTTYIPEQYVDEDPAYGSEKKSNAKRNSSGKSEPSRRKKQPSSSSSSSLSNSGSEDSGIVDEEMEQDENDDDNFNSEEDDEYEQDKYEEDVKVECPDWTELTSTLEFPSHPSFQTSYQETNLMKKFQPPPPPPIKMSMRANMDTLLTTAAAQLGGLIPVQFNLVGGDLGSSLDLKRSVLQPIKPSNNIPVNRQASFTDLGVPDGSDLLGDLNALEDSLEEGFGGINFVHEDPFQLFI
jgi:hypothetical protein